MGYIELLGERARRAQPIIAHSSTAKKNELLLACATNLLTQKDLLLQANARDLEAASDLSDAMRDRLRLDEARLQALADAARALIDLPDPVGQIESGSTRPNGLQIRKVKVPLGVIGIIFEARPNVTVDAALLCLKAGNAVILRGGKEALHTNTALADCLRAALERCGVTPDIIQLITDPAREIAQQMMCANDYIDVLIPRGGKGLIQSVVKNATVPTIQTGAGNCHLYVDETADLAQAAAVLFNAKTSRPSVCNACETLLVHSAVADAFLPLAKAKLDTKNVTLYGCAVTQRILGSAVLPADDAAYQTEFLDYTLAVRVVDDIDAAIAHINHYSTKHSETIMTQSLAHAEQFTQQINSAVVYVNASTRFTDGGEFGLGAEIGISTQMLHARGPMGLEALTTSQYIVMGQGQVR